MRHSRFPEGPRIALVLPLLQHGGVARNMLRLAKGLLERGVAIDIVLVRGRGPLLEGIPEQAHLVDLGARRALTAIPGLISYLRRRRPAALISATEYINLISIWSRYLARVPTRTVVTVRVHVSTATANAPTLRQRLNPLLIRYSYYWADHVVAVSHGVAADLATVTKLPREKIDVIHNPIVDSTMMEKAAEPIQHRWFQPDQPPVILGVGRLAKQKDFGTLVRAFEMIRRDRPAKLVILGEGDQRPFLQKEIQNLGLHNDVDLAGSVANPWAYMAKAAVFVLSSRWEGLPTVLVEALALGTPVVSTDCPGGSEEILAGGEFGTLVPVGDVDAMARAMTATLEASPDKEMLKARGWDFSIDRAVDAYQALLGRDFLRANQG